MTVRLVLVVLALLAVWVGPSVVGRRRPAGRSGGPGGRGSRSDRESARWATRRDLGPMLTRRATGDRLVLGRLGRRLVVGDPAHSVLVVGPTQSMKTSALAVPAILRWDGPVVAASVKADLARHTVAWRVAEGTTWVFDPTDTVAGDLVARGAHHLPWTPVDASGTWSGARRVAAALVDTARAGDAPMADGDFWYASAAKLLAPLLHAAAVSGATIGDVVRWLDEQDEATPTDALVDAGAWAALQAARACWGRDDRQRSAVYATAETVLAAFEELALSAPSTPDRPWAPDRPSMAGPSSTAGSPPGSDRPSTSDRLTPARWSASAVLDGANTVYLCAPAHQQRRLRPLFAALLTEIVQAALERAEHQGHPLHPGLLVVVDEAANVAPVPDLDVLAATAAGHGVQLVTVWQDMAQITARYGARAGTVVNNHRAKLFLSGIADPATIEHASVLVGEHDVHDRTTTVGPDGRVTTATAPGRRRLLPPDAVRRLAPGTGVLVAGHRQPCRVRLVPWFTDPELRRRAAGRATVSTTGTMPMP